MNQAYQTHTDYTNSYLALLELSTEALVLVIDKEIFCNASLLQLLQHEYISINIGDSATKILSINEQTNLLQNNNNDLQSTFISNFSKADGTTMAMQVKKCWITSELPQAQIYSVNTLNNNNLGIEISNQDKALKTEPWEFWILPNGKIEFHSEAVEKITGYCAQEWHDVPLLMETILCKKDKLKWNKHLHQILNSNEPIHQVDLKIKTKNGIKRKLQHSGQKIYDQNHIFLGYKGCNKTYLNQKEILRTLINQKQELSAIYKNIPLYLLTVNKQARILKANDQILINANLNSQNLLGVKIGNYFNCINTTEKADSCTQSINCPHCIILQSIKHTFATKEPIFKQKGILTYRLPEETKNMHILLSTSPIQINNEELVLVSIEDISKEIQINEALNNEKNRAQNILEATNAGTWDWDIESGNLIVNDRWTEMIGYKRSELEPFTYQKWKKLIHPNDMEEVISAIRTHLSNKSKYYDQEFRLKHKNGDWIWINGRGKVMLRTDLGKPLRMSGTHIDISKRKTAAEELSSTEQAIRKVIMATSGKEGSDFFTAMVKVLSEVTQSTYSLIGKRLPNKNIRTLAISKNGKIAENIEYPLEGTPCSNVINHTTCAYTNGVKELFPTDSLLADLNVEAYVGSPIINHASKPIGVIVSLFEKPLRNTHFIESILDVFSVRIASEMERLHSENALQESETKFRSIFNTSLDAIGVTKNDIHILANNAFLELFGYSSLDEVIGKTTLNFIAPSEKKSIETLSKIRSEGKTAHNQYETKGLRKDGSIFDLDVHVSNYYMNDEHFTQVILRDISKQKAITKELELHNKRLESLSYLSQATFKSTLEQINYAINQTLQLTESNTCLFFNYNEKTQEFKLKTGCNKTNLPLELPTDKHVYALQQIGLWGEAVRLRKAVFFNNISKKKEKTSSILLPRLKIKNYLSVPIFSDDEIKAVVVFVNKAEHYTQKDIKQVELVMDALWKIMEKRKYQEELIVAKEKAEESDRLKSAFLASMSHEIRTPLNSIIGFSEIIAESNEDPKLAHFSEIISKQNELLLKLVEDLIDFAKAEAGALEINNSSFSLNMLITELFFLYNTKCAPGVTLIPQKPDKSAIIFADEQRLKQVFSNLISNAIKFTHKGSITFGYEILESSEIHCFVKDTGIGITKENTELVFERFTKIDSFSQGTGLGLSIVRNIIQLMNGNIWLESEPGIGSNFYFKIPYQTEELLEINSVRPIKDSGVIPPFCVLIAEDDDSNFLYLNELLNNWECTIIRAIDGKEAVKIAKNNHSITFVLMDIKLPLLNGYEATKQIKRIRPHLPIIAQTAYSLPEDKQKAEIAGCDDYLAKPIKREWINQIVTRYTKTRH